jgi:three-Cys-motif partner protein
MQALEYYRGREQTYLKHFFLERYLERLAFKIGSWAPEFVYVDGFAGPWRVNGTEYEDTSFRIALSTLRKVRAGLQAIDKRPAMRCLFVEEKAESFACLSAVTATEQGLDAVAALHGLLEDKAQEIIRFVGSAFAMFFIDPTGWKGVGVNQLSPLLAHRPGEVLVNFMTDFINRRFLSDEHFDELYGMTQARSELERRGWSETTMVNLYAERLRAVGNFDYVTTTRIKKPTADRTYFHLIYGTRHPNGIKTFRAVEKQFIDEQELVRRAAKQAKRIERTNQGELFSAARDPQPSTFEEERAQNLRIAEVHLLGALERAAGALPARVLVPEVLQLPLVWESDISDIARRLVGVGKLEIVGMTARQRRLQDDMVLKLRR